MMWTCDTCKQPIDSVNEGYVEWQETASGGSGSRATGLRLVHQNGTCQYPNNAKLRDMPLSTFLETDGLVTLLSFLAEDNFPKEEVLDLIQRLHVPGFEAARPYFSDAVSRCIIEPNMFPGYFHQNEIKAVNEAVKNGTLP
jgi:hypothetical protein